MNDKSYYVVQYYLGNMKISNGRIANQIYQITVYAHDEEEVKIIVREQIRRRHNKDEFNITKIILTP